MVASKDRTALGTKVVKVRQAQPTDRNEWARMREALWPGAAAEHLRETESYFRHPDGRFVVFVAQEPGGKRLVGFLEAGLRDHAEECASSPVAYIEGWFVIPRYRRRGVGAALVEAAEEWARDRGLTEIASDTEIHNTGSQQAHLAIGYTETSRLVCFRKTLTREVESSAGFGHKT